MPYLRLLEGRGERRAETLEILCHVILEDRKMRVWPLQYVSLCWDEKRLNNCTSERLMQKEAGKTATQPGMSLFTFSTCTLTHAHT